MLKLLQELCACSGVSSFEDEVRACIRAHAQPYADEIRVDALGNLIVKKRGKKATGDKLVLCAHMDEVGLIVRHITDEGYLKFSAVGGIDRRVLIGKPVKVGEKGLPGVIGLKAYHLVSAEEEKVVPKLDDYYIDIGARSKAEAQALVSLGDCAVFESDWVEFGQGMVKAKALDDRAGCAALLKLLEEELPMDCTFVFTAQEEVGTRGAQVTSQAVLPDLAIVFEGSPADDFYFRPGIAQCSLKSGTQIRHLDASYVSNPEFIRLAHEIGEQCGIKYQDAVRRGGSTNAGKISLTGKAVPVLVLGIPSRYVHTHYNFCAMEDIDATVKMAAEVIKSLDRERIDRVLRRGTI